MRVTIRLFARLRDLAGSGVRDVTTRDGRNVWRSLVDDA
jgi:hypothetical protein